MCMSYLSRSLAGGPPLLFAPPSQILKHTITAPAVADHTPFSFALPSLQQSIAVLHYCHPCSRHILPGLIGPSSPGPLANQTPTPHTLRPAEGLKGGDPVRNSKPLIASHAATELPQLSLRIPSISLILLSSIILYRDH